MARTQSEKYPEIRENILKQAARLFAELGYPGTTIIDLAEACSSSRGALYHYFGSKEEILYEILHKQVNDLYDQVQAAVEAHDDPVEQCREVIRVVMMCNALTQNEQVVLLNHLGQLNEDQQREIVAKQRKLIEFVSDILIRMDRNRRVTTQNKKAYTMMLFGILNYTVTWYDPSGPIQPEEYARMTTDLFIRGLSGA